MRLHMKHRFLQVSGLIYVERASVSWHAFISRLVDLCSLPLRVCFTFLSLSPPPPPLAPIFVFGCLERISACNDLRTFTLGPSSCGYNVYLGDEGLLRASALLHKLCCRRF